MFKALIAAVLLSSCAANASLPTRLDRLVKPQDYWVGGKNIVGSAIVQRADHIEFITCNGGYTVDWINAAWYVIDNNVQVKINSFDGYSACTIFADTIRRVKPELICIVRDDMFFGFHSAKMEDGSYRDISEDTYELVNGEVYRYYSRDITDWVNRNGGWPIYGVGQRNWTIMPPEVVFKFWNKCK